MRTFRLIKDLPNLPQGCIFKTSNDGSSVFSSLGDDSKHKWYTFTLDEVLSCQDYFVEITDEMNEKERHLTKLIDKVADRLQFSEGSVGLGMLYLDPKRPFGFSGESTITRQILEFIGIEPNVPDPDYGFMDFTKEDRQYAKRLFQEDLLPAIIRKLKS